MAMSTLSLDEIEALAASALRALGVAPGNAAPAARALADGEALGVPEQGLAVLPAIAEALVDGAIDGAARPRITRPRVGLVRVEGRLGLGPPAIAAAAPRLVEAAREGTTALMSVSGIGPIGLLDAALIQMAAEGLWTLGLAGDGQLALAAPRGDDGISLVATAPGAGGGTGAGTGAEALALAQLATAMGGPLVGAAAAQGLAILAVDPVEAARQSGAATPPAQPISNALGAARLEAAGRAMAEGVAIAGITLADVRALGGRA
ncbi:MAG: Ldh family oxidoreductase [Pseudomonadota bacterium]